MFKKAQFALSLYFFCSLVTSQTIEINGAELEYEIKGNGEHVVFFEAGAISGMAGWDAIWDSLPENTQAIRYSRRGEGDSSSCHGDLTAENYVADAKQLLTQLKIDQPLTYVSHSYGSKVARLFASNYPKHVSAMLFIDPINPRDVDIIEQLDPINGKQSNDELKQSDIKMGKENGWCLINDIWDKSPSLGYGELPNIPVTLIAGVKKFDQPKRLFDSNEARDLWGQYQSEWVLKFPQGKAVMAIHSGHFVQDDEPELVVSELKALVTKLSQK